VKTNRILFTSGLLAAFTALVHTFSGTAEIQQPLLTSSLAKPISLLLFACWHLVTITLILSAIALIWSALPNNKILAGALPVFVSVLWLFFGFIFIVVALVMSGVPALFVLPQWILLLPVGILGLFGAQKQFPQR